MSGALWAGLALAIPAALVTVGLIIIGLLSMFDD